MITSQLGRSRRFSVIKTVMILKFLRKKTIRRIYQIQVSKKEKNAPENVEEAKEYNEVRPSDEISSSQKSKTMSFKTKSDLHSRLNR